MNLTRNVRISGTASGRTHVLIHSAVPQAISHVEVRHVGPQEVTDDGHEGVMGRYGLHFHHCGNGSRGSSVSGVVVAQAGNHAFVPHESHGITFTECVSHDTSDDAFWWDKPDGSHEISWIGCVASLVRTDPYYRGYRLAGFVLGVGDGSAVRGCCL